MLSRTNPLNQGDGEGDFLLLELRRVIACRIKARNSSVIQTSSERG
jgi:hypothetical protein